MKYKKHKKAHGLLNRPLFERTAVYGVAALVISAVAYVGVLTDKGDMAAARPPTIDTAIHDAGASPDKISFTLKGSHFLPGATVTLGERVVTEVTYVSSSTLRAVTTSPPTAHDTLIVKNPDGQSAVLASLPMPAAKESPQISVMDMSVVLSNMGGKNPAADLSDDGNVDAADLAVLLGAWAW